MPAALASRPQAEAGHEPSFSGDDLVLWQVLRTSPSSWPSIRYTGSDPRFSWWARKVSNLRPLPYEPRAAATPDLAVLAATPHPRR
jgi:hypothetical protein